MRSWRALYSNVFWLWAPGGAVTVSHVWRCSCSGKARSVYRFQFLLPLKPACQFLLRISWVETTFSTPETTFYIRFCARHPSISRKGITLRWITGVCKSLPFSTLGTARSKHGLLHRSSWVETTFSIPETTFYFSTFASPHREVSTFETTFPYRRRLFQPTGNFLITFG